MLQDKINDITSQIKPIQEFQPDFIRRSHELTVQIDKLETSKLNQDVFHD